MGMRLGPWSNVGSDVLSHLLKSYEFSRMLSPCGAHGKKMVHGRIISENDSNVSTNYYIIGFRFTTILFGQLTHNLETRWRFQPRWKIWSSNWIISPSGDENWNKNIWVATTYHLVSKCIQFQNHRNKDPQGVAVELPNKDPPASIMAAFSCTSSHGSLGSSKKWRNLKFHQNSTCMYRIYMKFQYLFPKNQIYASNKKSMIPA